MHIGKKNWLKDENPFYMSISFSSKINHLKFLANFIDKNKIKMVVTITVISVNSS